MQVNTRNDAEEMLSLNWAVAAEVRPHTDNPGLFSLAGLFFTTAFAMGDEWAWEYDMQEISAASLTVPEDWMAGQEQIWGPEHGCPFTIEDMRFWRDELHNRCFVSLEVNARELALVRQMAQLARARGHGELVGEYSPID
jgi:hypothetical protein